ncbi:MAG: FHA domain-containing protein [Armatimonadota bacterium]
MNLTPTPPSRGDGAARAAAAVCLLLLLVPLSAAEVKVVLDREAQVRAWAVPQLPEALPSAGAEFLGREFSLSIPEGLTQGWLVVLDVERANVAFAPWDGVTASYSVKESDWRIAEVEVRASFEGKPAHGLAVLRSQGKELTRLLAEGSATFFGIPPGEVSVLIRYVREGAQHETVPQRFDLTLQRAEAKPILAVSLPNAPDDMPAPADEDAGESSAAAQTSSGGRKWLPIAIALIVGAAALAGLYHFLKHHENRVAESLRRLGVKLPSDTPGSTTADAGSAPPDSARPPAAPAAQPITEGIEPVVPGDATPTDSPRRAFRLVGDGVALDVPGEGEYVLGRDAACDLPITDATVSRRHATLSVREGALLIRDDGSTNGTYVNGVRLEANTEHPLQPGDKLQVGFVKLRVES